MYIENVSGGVREGNSLKPLLDTPLSMIIIQVLHSLLLKIHVHATDSKSRVHYNCSRYTVCPFDSTFAESVLLSVPDGLKPVRFRTKTSVTCISCKHSLLLFMWFFIFLLKTYYYISDTKDSLGTLSGSARKAG